MILAPAATTHQQMTDEEQIAAGVTKDHLRLSVGIEHVDDIKADMQQAFAAVKATVDQSTVNGNSV